MARPTRGVGTSTSLLEPPTHAVGACPVPCRRTRASRRDALLRSLRGLLSPVIELWGYRGLIGNLAQRELKAKYKRSLLGMALVPDQPGD